MSRLAMPSTPTGFRRATSGLLLPDVPAPAGFRLKKRIYISTRHPVKTATTGAAVRVLRELPRRDIERTFRRNHEHVFRVKPKGDWLDQLVDYLYHYELAWSLAQSCKGVQTTASQTTADVTISPTAGNPLVIGAGNYGTRTVSSVATLGGSGSDSFTQCASAAAAGSTRGTDVWYLATAGSGRTGVRITFSGIAGTFNKEGYCWELSGIVGTFTFDLANGTGATGTTSQPTTPAITTTGAGTGFAVGVIVTEDSVTLNPETSPANEFTSGGIIGATSDAACSLLNPTSASHQAQWHLSGPGDNSTSIAAFKQVGGAAARPWDLAHTPQFQSLMAM